MEGCPYRPTALSAINYVGGREGAWVQRTFTYVKICGAPGLIGVRSSSLTLLPRTRRPAHPVPLAHFGVAIAACLMAYNGWSYVSFVAGEVRTPTQPAGALVIRMSGGFASVYPLPTSLPQIMDHSGIASTERVGAELAIRTIGPIGGTFVSLAVLLSIIGRERLAF